MTLARDDARDTVKSMLFITGTTLFDTALGASFDSAVARLYPRVHNEVDPETVTAVVDEYGEAVVNLSSLTAPVKDVRLVECRTSNSGWYPADHIFRHAQKLYVQGAEQSVSQLRLFGLEQLLVDGSGNVVIEDQYALCVYWYMISEFYSYLAADNSRYNSYTQSLGARAVDNLSGESQYFADKADQYIEERAQLYGSQ